MLLAKHAIAEEDAQHMRKVNADILGHQNPAQKIIYVENIRNELAATRQVSYLHFFNC
jgi:hypothetical protein